LVATLAFVASADAHPGDLDDTYGRGGIVQTDPTPDDQSSMGLAVGSDGRAFYLEDLFTDLKLVGLTRSGQIDMSFGTGGRVDLSSKVLGFAMAVSPGGKVVVAGYDPASSSSINVVRVARDGRLDPTFGNGGVVSLNYPGFVSDVDFDGAGRLVVLANSFDGAQLIRLNDDGSYDETFGNGGISPPGVDQDAHYFLSGPDGSLFVMFDAGGFQVEKYTPSGQLDQSFGEGGISTPDSYGGFIFGGAFTVDAAGRLIYVRTQLIPPFESPGQVSHIYRLTPDGQLDPSFAAAPELLDPSADGKAMHLYGILADDQSRILLSGSYGEADGSGGPDATDPLIARLLPDGSLDSSFGEGGISSFPLAYSDFPFAGFGELLPAGPNRVMSSGVGFLSRIELDDAVGDADADTVRDKEDGCPRRYSEHRDGCGRIQVNLSIDGGERQISGQIKTAAPCLARGKTKPAHVRVFAVVKNGKKRLGSAKVDLQGHWSYRLPPGHQKIYAAYPEHRRLDIAVCHSAKSKAVSG
jgi:uncharacterized delta-60 repeat protein